MNKKTLIVNATIINEGTITEGDVLISGKRIEKIDSSITNAKPDLVVDAKGKWLMPGVIDDQVHFREPGLTYKANIETESRAALAGGITSYMEMPNTKPPALTQELLQDKYDIAAQSSYANYSFFMGVSNENLEQALKTDKKKVCGLKVFMGSSTGNMLVDDEKTLRGIFRQSELLIATHCEDEKTVRKNLADYKERYGENVPFHKHSEIRSREACYISSSLAVSLAREYDTRLHILHISTAEELGLFSNKVPLSQKRITSEVCVHHLSFSQQDYHTKGALIKWNPAVKKSSDRTALWKALNNDTLDIVATDHAPHTIEEKGRSYFQAPSGGPLVQHSLVKMLQHVKEGRLTLEKMVEKMCHSPATMFQIESRGFVREGYYADLVLVDPNAGWTVSKENVLSKCGWSPFEGATMDHKVEKVFLNGNLAYDNGSFSSERLTERLLFERE